MNCPDIDVCMNEISAYYNADVSGYPLVVNVDDYKLYQLLISRINNISGVNLVRVSDYCNADNMPDMNTVFSVLSGSGKYLLWGISQFSMLIGEEKLVENLNRVVSLSVNGHVVVVVNGCAGLLNAKIMHDIRLEHRIIVVGASKKLAPDIEITNDVSHCYAEKYSADFKHLLVTLEDYIPHNDELSDKVYVVTRFSMKVFSKSMYSISECGGIYDILCSLYSDVSASTKCEWGTDEQWRDLSKRINRVGTLASVIDDVIGSTVNLQSYMEEKFEDTNSLEAWYLWIAMKTFGVKNNLYLNACLDSSNSAKEFVNALYMNLLNYSSNADDFNKLYSERKKLLIKLPENDSAIQEYCNHVGQHNKNAIYYLTDLTDREKLLYLKFLEANDYSEQEIIQVCQFAFPELYLYLGRYEFTESNTPNPLKDADIHRMLTDYFAEYKLQKITNKIHKVFLDKVNEYSKARPFNKLAVRNNLISAIDRNKAQVYFFDALGVEFLSYIVSKCEKFGLQTVVNIGHCDLPSITKINSDFKKFFVFEKNEDGHDIIPGTKELDELKHHSKEIDFTKCKQPIHLFMELEIIDKELRKIKNMLVTGQYDKIIIVSDHGASRLAVLNQSESELFTLENNAEHSGRCCETSETPNLEYASYENGYAVLANYDRFKGSRKANVEVHGGATLEETVVPIIEISCKPEVTEVYITNNYIEFHNRETVSVTVYSNILISNPRIVIQSLDSDGYIGVKSADNKHYVFDIKDIRRTGNYRFDLFDGNKPIMQGLEFSAKKLVAATKDFF